MKIEIPRRSLHCALGNESLQEGMWYYSVLEEEVRRDYCCRCWMEMGEKLPHPFWKAKVLTKTSSQKRQVVDFSRYAFLLLKEALSKGNEEEAQEEAQEEAFVLALYLARKRQLILRSEMQREKETFFLYEVVETEEMLTVKKLDLSTVEAEKVQNDLAKKFASNG